MSYHVCILGPAAEEVFFRGGIQLGLKRQFNQGFKNLGLSDCFASAASCITAVVVTSVLFGLIHFANAFMILCDPLLCLFGLCALNDGFIDINWILLFLNPMSYLPQVISATIMGLIFGLAQEFSGEVYAPISMHIGNNTLVWAMYLNPAISIAN
jgi:membrane protease YdiL (CAAX protease family)